MENKGKSILRSGRGRGRGRNTSPQFRQTDYLPEIFYQPQPPPSQYCYHIQQSSYPPPSQYYSYRDQEMNEGFERFNLLITVTVKNKPTMTIPYPSHKRSKTRKRRGLKKYNQSRHVEEANEVVKVDKDDVVKAPARRRQTMDTTRRSGFGPIIYFYF